MNSKAFANLYMQKPFPPPVEIADPRAGCPNRDYRHSHALSWEGINHARCRHCDGIYFSKDLHNEH